MCIRDRASTSTQKKEEVKSEVKETAKPSSEAVSSANSSFKTPEKFENSKETTPVKAGRLSEKEGF